MRSTRAGNGKDNEAKYRTETVERGAVAETVTATGTISAVTTVQVGSQVSGIIQSLHADYNSPVKKGQLLATLDPTPFQTQVEQRQADVLQARSSNAQRRSAVSPQRAAALGTADAGRGLRRREGELRRRQGQVAQAEAALKQAETNLSYTRIYSPIDGTVVARQYDIGQTVAASFQAPTLFTIAEDLEKMQVQADVDQSDISRVATGQKARFTVDAYPEESFVGDISQIRLNATQNQNVITYPVIIDVPNPDGKLKPKMTADVTIEVSKVDDVVRIPNAALRFKPIETGRPGEGEGVQRTGIESSPRRGVAGAADGLAASRNGGGGKRSQSVYVVEAGGAVKAVAIRTGITDGRFTEVREGDLKPGDKVAVGFVTAKVNAPTTLPPGMGGGGGRGGGGGGRR